MSGSRFLPPAVVVHGLADVEAALAPFLPVTLLSAPGAAGYAGVGWWAALMARAARIAGGPVIHLLDCASQPGRALEAMRAGLPGLVLDPCPQQIAVIARETGTLLLTARPAALDLAVAGARRKLAAWLGGDIQIPIG